MASLPAALRCSVCLLAFLLLMPTPVSGQCRTYEDQKLLASDGSLGDVFGFCVAQDEDVAIIGAPTWTGPVGRTGAAYLFRRSGNAWVEEQRFDPGTADFINSRFGEAVDVLGDVAVVGAYAADGVNQDTGVVQVLAHDGSTWNLAQTLSPSASDGGQFFGRRVSLDANTLLIGAERASTTGVVYVFEHDGSQWSEVQKLTPSDGVSGWFGAAVALDGDTAWIGAPIRQQGEGGVYVFQRNAGTWTETDIFTLNNPTTSDRFGYSVAVDGMHAVVGAIGRSFGEAHAYTHNGSAWVKLQKLATPGSADSFGLSASLDGELAVIGGSTIVGSSGVATLYRLQGSTWTKVVDPISGDRASGDSFGICVSLHGTRLLAGASGDDDLGSVSGSAYSFDLPELGFGVPLPARASEGDTVDLTACGGLDGGLAMVVAVDVSGIPMFVQLGKSSFGADGQVVFSGNVPAGLAGLNVTFLTVGFYQSGQAGLSNVGTMLFQ